MSKRKRKKKKNGARLSSRLYYLAAASVQEISVSVSGESADGTEELLSLVKLQGQREKREEGGDVIAILWKSTVCVCASVLFKK